MPIWGVSAGHDLTRFLGYALVPIFWAVVLGIALRVVRRFFPRHEGTLFSPLRGRDWLSWRTYPRLAIGVSFAFVTIVLVILALGWSYEWASRIMG